MIKINRAKISPKSLDIEKAKGSENYRCEDVIQQLSEDFHGKCYLCEIRLQDVNVEHLKAHHGNRDRMFDWNNLFLCCPHCNGVKNQKCYEESIIDCCKVEPESVMNQKFSGGHVKVESLNPSAESTARLVEECFEKRNTGIRILESQIRIDELQKTMNLLYRCLQEYSSKPTQKTFRALRAILSRKYTFAGFTRNYVRQNIDKYPKLKDLVEI